MSHIIFPIFIYVIYGTEMFLHEVWKICHMDVYLGRLYRRTGNTARVNRNKLTHTCMSSLLPGIFVLVNITAITSRLMRFETVKMFTVTTTKV